MKIRLKLFALLAKYLPPGAENNEIELDVAEGATPAQVLGSLALPEGACHLVLINGEYLAPSERTTRPLKAGDALAAWPPVAGG